MKNLVSIILVGFCVTICAENIYACEPCAQIYDLDRTIYEADLIIIGQKIDEEKRTSNQRVGPDWIKIRINKILKGEEGQNVIIVNSWNGMCPYGIDITGDENYLIILEKLNIENAEIDYNAVNSGCAQKSYQIIGDRVDLDGRSIAVKELKEKMKL